MSTARAIGLYPWHPRTGALVSVADERQIFGGEREILAGEEKILIHAFVGDESEFVGGNFAFADGRSET